MDTEGNDFLKTHEYFDSVKMQVLELGKEMQVWERYLGDAPTTENEKTRRSRKNRFQLSYRASDPIHDRCEFRYQFADTRLLARLVKYESVKHGERKKNVKIENELFRIHPQISNSEINTMTQQNGASRTVHADLKRMQ
jgi:NH3-dependent NAD+ synthetase